MTKLAHSALAARMQQIQPFYVMELLARAKAMEARGISVVHMEVGEPDFVTPEPIMQAAAQALQDHRCHYTPALGLPALRQAIADYYAADFQLEIDPRRVCITPGASGGLQLALAALVDAGDEVLMTDPGYPCNRHMVSLLGGQPISLAVSAENNFQPNRQQLESQWGAASRALLLASPANPTGSVISESCLRDLYHCVSQLGGILLVDEIYQGLTYTNAKADITALSIADDVFVINSFSKFFGMTGMRLGWVVAPEWAVDAIDRLAQNLFLAPATLSQYAALAAFEPATRAIMEQRRQAFAARRDFLLPAVRQLGFNVKQVPEGAFYLYADCSELTDDSFAFVNALLDQQGVAITPGCDFGHYKAEQYVRFAYTTRIEQMQQGVDGISRFLR